MGQICEMIGFICIILSLPLVILYNRKKGVDINLVYNSKTQLFLGALVSLLLISIALSTCIVEEYVFDYVFNLLLNYTNVYVSLVCTSLLFMICHYNSYKNNPVHAKYIYMGLLFYTSMLFRTCTYMTSIGQGIRLHIVYDVMCMCVSLYFVKKQKRTNLNSESAMRIDKVSSVTKSYDSTIDNESLKGYRGIFRVTDLEAFDKLGFEGIPKSITNSEQTKIVTVDILPSITRKELNDACTHGIIQIYNATPQ